MKCPNCKEDMENGNILSQDGPGLFYAPIGQKLKKFSRKEVEKKGGLVLAGPFFIRFRRTEVPCFRCRKCRMIIISR